MNVGRSDQIMGRSDPVTLLLKLAHQNLAGVAPYSPQSIAIGMNVNLDLIRKLWTFEVGCPAPSSRSEKCCYCSLMMAICKVNRWDEAPASKEENGPVYDQIRQILQMLELKICSRRCAGQQPKRWRMREKVHQESRQWLGPLFSTKFPPNWTCSWRGRGCLYLYKMGTCRWLHVKWQVSCMLSDMECHACMSNLTTTNYLHASRIIMHEVFIRVNIIVRPPHTLVRVSTFRKMQNILLYVGQVGYGTSCKKAPNLIICTRN